MKSKTEETSGLVPMSLITSALHSLPPSCKAPYFSCLHKSVTHPQTSAQIGLLFAGHDSTWLLPKFRCSIATTFWSSLSWSYSWATALEDLWLMTCCEAHVMTQPVRPPFFKKLAPRLQVRRQQEVWNVWNVYGQLSTYRPCEQMLIHLRKCACRGLTFVCIVVSRVN